MTAIDRKPALQRGHTVLTFGATRSNTAKRPPDPRLMTRILIIDGEVEAAAHLQRRLQEEGYWVDVEREWNRDYTTSSFRDYAMIILDIVAWQTNGFEVLRQIREKSAVPILVLTSLSDENDGVAGLELGADDYVVKPGRPRELVARIRALLRRTNVASAPNDAQEVLRSGRLTMWPAQRQAECHGDTLRLTSTEFSLLELLLREVGRPVSKADLFNRALGRLPARHDRSIDVHLCSVRRKLGVLPDGRPLIQAVHLRGYQLLKE